MQSMLYLVEEADAHNRNGNFGMALKRYMSVKRVRQPHSHYCIVLMGA
jgi:peptide alpha-N-acetyltransferase